MMKLRRVKQQNIIMVIQREITLRPQNRGFHLATTEISTQIPELKTIRHGLLHIL